MTANENLSRRVSQLPGVVAALMLFLPPARAQTGPSITHQPASQTNSAGSSATLSVSVSGSGPFTYEWRFNGTNLPNDIITTVAGGGIGDDGPATTASLKNPEGVAIDASGNLFIADAGHGRIRKVDPHGTITTVALGGPNVAVDISGNVYFADGNRICKVDVNGMLTTVAGNGLQGYSGDGGAATNASLSGPSGVAVGISGNLFIADENNQVVREVDVDGIIATVAGNGSYFYSGDGGQATNASLYYPSGVAVDAYGNLFIADMYNERIRKVDINGIITTVAGDGMQGYLGDGGAATEAPLFTPSGVAVDHSGNLFIAELGDSRIRKVNIDGVITTVGGNGSDGYSGDGGAATNAALYVPYAVAVDASGNIFIADGGNDCVRKINIQGVITTVAGNGSYGGYLGGFSGDGGPATNAGLNLPTAVAIDASGNLFIADQGNNRIRKVDTHGAIATVAGVGLYLALGDNGPATNATLNAPTSVAVDSSGNLFIADQNNTRIRKVDAKGLITTVAGTGSQGYYGDGGPATNAWLYMPSAVVLDASDDLFITDQANNRIRKVDVNGIITTVAGSGRSGVPSGSYSGDGGAATNARLNSPTGVAVDASGNLFIADQGNNCIRKVDVNGVITTVVTGLSNPYGVTVDSSGDLFIADQYSNRILKMDIQGVITTVAGFQPYGNQSELGDGSAATASAVSLWYPSGVALDSSGNLFIADQYNARIREVSFGGSPQLTLVNLSTANVGDYQAIISNRYGSVTSAVASLSVVATTIPNPAITMRLPIVSGHNLVLGFTLSQTSTSPFTLLQAPSITGPWATNTGAVLTTNAQTLDYQFSLHVPASVSFYQVRTR